MVDVGGIDGGAQRQWESTMAGSTADGGGVDGGGQQCGQQHG